MADELTCAACKWSELWFLGEHVGDDYDTYLCTYPASRMPISMQGVAQRERSPVRSNQTGCPCWEA